MAYRWLWGLPDYTEHCSLFTLFAVRSFVQMPFLLLIVFLISFQTSWVSKDFFIHPEFWLALLQFLLSSRKSVPICRKCTLKYSDCTEPWTIPYDPQLPAVLLREGSRHPLVLGSGRATEGEHCFTWGSTLCPEQSTVHSSLQWSRDWELSTTSGQ